MCEKIRWENRPSTNRDKVNNNGKERDLKSFIWKNSSWKDWVINRFLSFIKQPHEIRAREKQKKAEEAAAAAEADKTIASAKAAIEAEKTAAIAELKNQAASLSIDVAEKILGQELSAENKQTAMIGKIIEDVKFN